MSLDVAFRRVITDDRIFEISNYKISYSGVQRLAKGSKAIFPVPYSP